MALPLSMGELAGGEVCISMTKEVGIKSVNKFKYCTGAKIKIGYIPVYRKGFKNKVITDFLTTGKFNYHYLFLL